MSLIPAFEIGLWNGWIPAIYWIVIPIILAPLVSKEALKKVLTSPPANKTEKTIMNILQPMSLALLIYPIFVPLKLGTMWFYVGLFVFLVGAAIYTIASVNFVTTPLDKLVTKGVYSVSRHPIHFSYFIMSRYRHSLCFMDSSIVFCGIYDFARHFALRRRALLP